MIKRLGIHILALNETKLDNSSPKELTDISGYQQLRLDRSCHGGGVSVYSISNLGTIFKQKGLNSSALKFTPPPKKNLFTVGWEKSLPT